MRDGPRDRGGADASGPPPFRGPAYKTKLCALWRGRDGGCPRPDCGFAHGEAELRRPPHRPSFQRYPRFGRRDSRDHDFRFRPERRHSPRYSPEERETRGRSFRNEKQSSQDRGSSHSRSPTRERNRKHRKSPDGGKSDSSDSFRTFDNEDSEKDEKYPCSVEKNADYEAHLKQVNVDMEALREDKSKLEMILEKKIEEVHKLSSKVDDLESQLNETKEDCQRMASKTKKVMKAHARYKKAQEEVKRSQARFERLADLLASDTLKPCNKEQGYSGNANEDQYIAYETSPSDQRQNHLSTARKRSMVLSRSDEEKTGKKMREADDMILMPEKYRLEHAIEPPNNGKGNGILKSFSVQKKLGDGGNIVSASNVFADRYGDEDEDVHVD